MSATAYTIHIKNLAGDLVTLTVNSSTGIQGVEQALKVLDPDAYGPLFPFRLFSLESESEDEKEEVPIVLHEGMTLGIYTFPPPELIRVESYSTIDCFEFHIYGKPLYLYTIASTCNVLWFRLSTTFIPYDDAVRSNQGTPGYPYCTSIYLSAVGKGYSIHPTHTRLLLDHILEYIRAHRDPQIRVCEPSSERIACSCGAIVQRRSMTSHQKTKKHLNKAI